MILLPFPRAEGTLARTNAMDSEIIGTLPLSVEFLYVEDGEVTGCEMRGTADDRVIPFGEIEG